MRGRWQPGQEVRGTPYRVHRHIGSGGMGSLYEVEDTSVGRVYVLKTLHPEMIDREDLAIRMREEARALGRLDHPNVVQVITAGVTADATPYYVMERLVGQNLRGVLDARGGLGKPHAYRIAIDVLEALQHAHDNGMIHRDVKPENIFLHRGKNGTQTKLLDFGIVRLLSKHASLTRGKFIGTLKYSSPEQVTGRPLGPASDIYSAALVVYEMLRGSGPFDLVGDAFAIGAAHVGTAPAPLGGIVPSFVDAILMQALAKEPAARPASCALIAAELRKALRAEESRVDATTELDVLSAHHPIEGEPTAAPDTNVERADPTETASGRAATTRVEGAAAGPAPGVRGTLPLGAQLLGASGISATLAAPLGGAPGTPPHLVAQRAGAGGGAHAPNGAQVLNGPKGVHGPQVLIGPNDPAWNGGASGGNGIDRGAPTRISAAEPVRGPSNDTRIDAPEPPAPTGVVHGAPPPSSGAGKPAGRVEVPTVHTRPVRADRTAVAAVAVAATLAVMMIVGAVVLVRRPWDSSRQHAPGAGAGGLSASATH